MQQSETALVAHLRGCIDLGELGALIEPVQVEGKTYMVLSTTKGEEHTWDNRISMRKLQETFFGENKVTEHNRICEVQGYQLCLPTDAELVAIHQHFSGAPPGWVSSSYWSATPSGSGHAVVSLINGNVVNNIDSSNSYVAFQVL
jgi:hypothetical protein